MKKPSVTIHDRCVRITEIVNYWLSSYEFSSLEQARGAIAWMLKHRMIGFKDARFFATHPELFVTGPGDILANPDFEWFQMELARFEAEFPDCSTWNPDEDLVAEEPDDTAESQTAQAVALLQQSIQSVSARIEERIDAGLTLERASLKIFASMFNDAVEQAGVAVRSLEEVQSVLPRLVSERLLGARTARKIETEIELFAVHDGTLALKSNEEDEAERAAYLSERGLPLN